jgi:methylated-DNA-[protein]-cysteine S-methyltransferase
MIDNDPLERELRISAAREADFPLPLPDLGEVAATAGLLDVAYATLDSPLGTLLLAVTDRGLVRLAYADFEGEDEVIAELSSRISPRLLAVPRRLDAARRELDEYFTGSRHEFEVPVDWRLTHGFGRRVLRATAKIPYGAVSSYKQVAAAAGSPRGSRAAGNALGSNPIPIVVPCHRVLHAGGGLGGYTGGLDRKRLLLAVEKGEPAGDGAL